MLPFGGSTVHLVHNAGQAHCAQSVQIIFGLLAGGRAHRRGAGRSARHRWRGADWPPVDVTDGLHSCRVSGGPLLGHNKAAVRVSVSLGSDGAAIGVILLGELFWASEGIPNGGAGTTRQQ